MAEVPHPPPCQVSSKVRELSISLLKDAMKTVVGRNKKRMKKQVRRVLLPLFLRMNDQTESVAKVQWSATSGMGRGVQTPQGWPGTRTAGRRSLGMRATAGSHCSPPAPRWSHHCLPPSPLLLGLCPRDPRCLGLCLQSGPTRPVPFSRPHPWQQLSRISVPQEIPAVVAVPCPRPGHRTQYRLGPPPPLPRRGWEGLRT